MNTNAKENKFLKIKFLLGNFVYIQDCSYSFGDYEYAQQKYIAQRY